MIALALEITEKPPTSWPDVAMYALGVIAFLGALYIMSRY